MGEGGTTRPAIAEGGATPSPSQRPAPLACRSGRGAGVSVFACRSPKLLPPAAYPLPPSSMVSSPSSGAAPRPPRRSISRMSASGPVRVRFAPSPTGLLHVGGGRTALFNWLFATVKRGGKVEPGAFILRIEDTDRARFVEGAERGIFDILHWFGLDWDEGPDVGGPFGPYVQSERTDLYRDTPSSLVEQRSRLPLLLHAGAAAARARSAAGPRAKRPATTGIAAICPATRSTRKLAAGEPLRRSLRHAARGRNRRVHDLLRGEMAFQNANLEDLVLLKSDGYPTYHLANVVDDHMMEITHIMRGEEWIPTAPLHVLLYGRSAGMCPKLAHMPLILAPGGGKLSKRHGSTAMEEFRDAGLSARSADELPGAARLELRRHDRDLLAGRSAGEVHAGAGQPLARRPSTTTSCSGSTSTTSTTS